MDNMVESKYAISVHLLSAGGADVVIVSFLEDDVKFFKKLSAKKSFRKHLDKSDIVCYNVLNGRRCVCHTVHLKKTGIRPRGSSDPSGVPVLFFASSYYNSAHKTSKTKKKNFFKTF